MTRRPSSSPLARSAGLTERARQSSDMPQEMVQEAVEIVTMSVDKFINVKNYEASTPLRRHVHSRQSHDIYPRVGRHERVAQ